MSLGKSESVFIHCPFLVGRVTSTLPVPVLLLHMCTVHGKSTKDFHYSRDISRDITPCLDQNLYSACLTAKW